MPIVVLLLVVMRMMRMLVVIVIVVDSDAAATAARTMRKGRTQRRTRRCARVVEVRRCSVRIAIAYAGLVVDAVDGIDCMAVAAADVAVAGVGVGAERHYLRCRAVFAVEPVVTPRSVVFVETDMMGAVAAVVRSDVSSPPRRYRTLAIAGTMQDTTWTRRDGVAAQVRLRPRSRWTQSHLDERLPHNDPPLCYNWATGRGARDPRLQGFVGIDTAVKSRGPRTHDFADLGGLGRTSRQRTPPWCCT